MKLYHYIILTFSLISSLLVNRVEAETLNNSNLNYFTNTYIVQEKINEEEITVEYLFDLIDKGTPVWIGNDIKLKEFGLQFK